MSVPSRLISPSGLLDRLDDPSVAIVEVSFSPSNDSYRRAHIPGAAWAYWKDLLWDPAMRAFASPATLGARLGELGVGSDQTLAVYGEPVQFGAYALWVLAAHGQHNVRFLDGGKDYWLAAGLPLKDGVETPRPRKPRAFGETHTSSIAGRDTVLAAVASGSHAILDFRSPEEYSGERVSPYDMPGGVDHGAERAGRIPSARHFYYRDLLREDATLRPPEEIVAALQARGVTLNDPILAYCRLSHRASLGWLALTEAGARDVRVYDGSWTEWGSIVGVPIER
jgi:thiosulfate/3-mercaptopyruvate sulfurtransferase